MERKILFYLLGFCLFFFMIQSQPAAERQFGFGFYVGYGITFQNVFRENGVYDITDKLGLGWGLFLNHNISRTADLGLDINIQNRNESYLSSSSTFNNLFCNLRFLPAGLRQTSFMINLGAGIRLKTSSEFSYSAFTVKGGAGLRARLSQKENQNLFLILSCSAIVAFTEKKDHGLYLLPLIGLETSW